jgi:hypothetical protein
MEAFEVGVRIDEKADLVWPVAVTPRGSAEQVTEGASRPQSVRPHEKALTKNGH